jgi:predicted  nucleic acid-binding Zn-ribbon protein
MPTNASKQKVLDANADLLDYLKTRWLADKDALEDAEADVVRLKAQLDQKQRQMDRILTLSEAINDDPD